MSVRLRVHGFDENFLNENDILIPLKQSLQEGERSTRVTDNRIKLFTLNF